MDAILRLVPYGVAWITLPLISLAVFSVLVRRSLQWHWAERALFVQYTTRIVLL
jgi:hypothetical protein